MEAQLDKLQISLHCHSNELLSAGSIWTASCLLVDVHPSSEHSLQLKRKPDSLLAQSDNAPLPV